MPERYERPASLADEAYSAIHDMIVTRQIPTGAVLSEMKLSEMLGLGRTPVREALQRLKLEGYLEIHARWGARVTAVDLVKQLDLVEVRRPLEQVLARLACERATPAEREHLNRLADDLHDAVYAPDVARYLSVLKHSHLARPRASHNRQLEQTMWVLLGLSRFYWFSYSEPTGSFNEAGNFNIELTRQLAEGDVRKASATADAYCDFLIELSQRAVRLRQ